MSPALRIALIVDPISALVGSGRHAFELSRELARRGHEVRAFGMPPALLEGAQSESGRNGVKLGASLASFAPEALLAYDALSPAAWIGARAARRRQAPLALVESGLWGERRLLQRTLGRVGEALWGAYVRRAASAVIALDPAVREVALRRGFAPELVHLVPHGVDLEQYRPGLPSDALARHGIRGRILCCNASNAAVEPVEALIQAFARTVGQRDDWSLVVTGDDAALARLRVAADCLGVGSRVHALALSEGELPGVLASSTLFAAPCVRGGNALLDVARALACGLPLLGADAAELRSLVADDELGLLAPAGDVAAWTQIIRRAASSPECRRRWGRAARSAAEKRLGWPSVAARFEGLLRATPRAASDVAGTELDSAAGATR